MPDSTFHVLLVDDEPDFTGPLAERLRRRGFTVTVADNGEQALARVHTATPDVVLLDVRMPGLDGISTMQRLRADHPHIEVILLTGHESVRSGVDGMRRGAFDYLAKPIAIEELVEKLSAACAHKRTSGATEQR
jgi:two-component system OmpR family response regulator